MRTVSTTFPAWYVWTMDTTCEDKVGDTACDARELTPRWLLPLAAQGVAWFDGRLFPRTPTAPL